MNRYKRFSPLSFTISLITPLILVHILCLTSTYAQEESFGGETPPPEQTTCETPDILLLLDRSGSMLDDNKWGQATSALTEVFVPYFDTLRFGLMTFPSSGSCGVAEGDLAVSIGDANRDRLEDIYLESTPTDEALTPLSEAIRIGHLALEDIQVPNRRSYLILLTDGIETCAPVALEDSAPITATRNAADAGFNTYVIGFGSLVRRSTLREMALAGGTERERLVTDQAQLSETLTEIINSATTERCDRLDNDCDGRVDEELDCEPTCDIYLEDCPCNNNGDCGLGEYCEEGLCAPPPCSTLCDQGYICFEDRCIREGDDQNGGENSAGSSSSGSQEEQFGEGISSTQNPSVPLTQEGESMNVSTTEQSCQSLRKSDLTPFVWLLFIAFTVLGLLIQRERSQA